MKQVMLVLFLAHFICNASNDDSIAKLNMIKSQKKESNSGGGNKTEKEPCVNIRKTIDDFTGEITFIFSDKGNQISFIKYIKNGVTDYYVSISIKENGIYTGKGVYFILMNGKKINKPNEDVDYDYNDGFYTSAFFKLSKQDIEMFKESPIDRFKAYISEGATFEPEETFNKFKCLLNKK
ncbi:MAG TPA: hypothetical protein PLS10_14085 [Chitinophagales bacterium]|nr:hypothetical protein [Chitinophagales bacterium]